MKTILWCILCLLHQVRAIQITRDVWYALTSHQYNGLCVSETQPQPDMNNTERRPHASTNQAADQPAQPAETKATYTKNSLTVFLVTQPFEGFLPLIVRLHRTKNIQVRHEQYIKINDRRQIVKIVCLPLQFTSRLCNRSHRFDLSPISKTSTTSKTRGISYRDSSKYREQQQMIVVI